MVHSRRTLAPFHAATGAERLHASSPRPSRPATSFVTFSQISRKIAQQGERETGRAVARDAAARHPVSVALLRIFVYITLHIFLCLWAFRPDGRNDFHVSVMFSIVFFQNALWPGS